MLEVKELTTTFKVGDKQVTAVDHISFDVGDNEVVGLVGESGSGKSVTSLSIMNLLPPNGAIVDGQVLWKGRDIVSMPERERRVIRGKEIGLIFQNPLAALNPVFTIGNQMIETIQLHRKVSKDEARHIAADLLKKVNIPDAESRLNDYPHQFSIGMCQRIMIALTLSMQPALLIADEPTASLDVTIQAQVLKLLNELRSEFDMSVLIISHDLGVIAQHCDKVLIMYLGNIIEKGSPHQVFHNPLHPYTKALIHSIPLPDPDKKQELELLKGEIPSPMNLPTGCPFHPRCPKFFDGCDKKKPKLIPHEGADVACFLYN